MADCFIAYDICMKKNWENESTGNVSVLRDEKSVKSPVANSLSTGANRTTLKSFVGCPDAHTEVRGSRHLWCAALLPGGCFCGCEYRRRNGGPFVFRRHTGHVGDCLLRIRISS